MTALNQTLELSQDAAGQSLAASPCSLPLVVSFSGGRTSAMMARMIQVSPIYAGRKVIHVYANTGKEREETLEFIRRCDEEWGFDTVWLEAVISPEKGEGTSFKVVDYKTAIRNTDPMAAGHPFFDLCKKYGIPSNSAPHCTRELKTKTIRKYLTSIGLTKWEEAWGIRADEPQRATPRGNVVYPMVEIGITEPMVRRFWTAQPFDLGLKDYQGNCDLCFKKSLRKRLTILRESPALAADWSALEGVQEYGSGKVGHLTFDRNGLTMKDLLAMSGDPKLEQAVDKHDARIAEESRTPWLFEMAAEINWDYETTCHCQST